MCMQPSKCMCMHAGGELERKSGFPIQNSVLPSTVEFLFLGGGLINIIKYIHYMNKHYIQHKTDNNYNVDCSHTKGSIRTRPSEAARAMVVFLTGWWKVDLHPLMHKTDDLRTAKSTS